MLLLSFFFSEKEFSLRTGLLSFGIPQAAALLIKQLSLHYYYNLAAAAAVVSCTKEQQLPAVMWEQVA